MAELHERTPCQPAYRVRQVLRERPKVVTTPANLLDIARNVALEAGQAALEQRAHGVTVAATKTSALDIVTAVDQYTEALIRSRLQVARPSDGFLGEESLASAGSSGLTWVVDPIDGTVNFLYGIPAWAISIAVVEGGGDPQTWRALAGVVFNPITGELFEASAGGGAFANKVAITVNTGVPLNRALVGTGFGYRTDVKHAQIRILTEVLPSIRDIRRGGSASLDLCDLARGRLDAYYERGLQPWDHAAGAIIAEEAGARVGGTRGRPASQELLVAAAPELQASLLETIESAEF